MIITFFNQFSANGGRCDSAVVDACIEDGRLQMFVDNVSKLPTLEWFTRKMLTTTMRSELIWLFFFLCFLVFSDGAGSKGDVKGRWRPTHRTRCGRKIYIGGTGPVRRRHRPRHDTGEYSFVLFTVHGFLFIQMLWEFNPMYDRQGKLKKRIALVGHN